MKLTFSFGQSAGVGVNQSQLKMLQDNICRSQWMKNYIMTVWFSAPTRESFALHKCFTDERLSAAQWAHTVGTTGSQWSSANVNIYIGKLRLPLGLTRSLCWLWTWDRGAGGSPWPGRSPGQCTAPPGMLWSPCRRNQGKAEEECQKVIHKETKERQLTILSTHRTRGRLVWLLLVSEDEFLSGDI